MNKLDMLYITSFRYCLGRRTYIVGMFKEFLFEDIDKLSYNTIAIMHKEINEAKSLGDDCDNEVWLEVLKKLGDKL